MTEDDMLPTKASRLFFLSVLTVITLGLIGLVGCQDVSGSSTPDDPDKVRLEEVPLSEEDEEEGIEIPVGERRVRVDVDFDRAVAGNIRPGDRVDVVYATNITSPFRPEADEGDSWKTVLLLQNVTVLGVDDSRVGDGSLGVSLSLAPEEAELLLVSQANGPLTIALRSETDLDVVPVKFLTLESVLEDLEVMYRVRNERVDQVRFSDRAAPDESLPLAERIPYDERALTLRVPRFRGDKWKPKPGDRVDLSVIVDDERALERSFDEAPSHHSGSPMSLDLLAEVEVLAIDEHRAEDGGDLLTVSLTPDEIEMLVSFEMVGQIRAWLRPEGERRPESPKTWYLTEMLDELQQLSEQRQSLVAEQRQGMRAITLAPEAIDKQSLLPEPESSIDIVGILPPSTFEFLPEHRREEVDRMVSVTLMQNVSVLQKHDDTVTIAVTPQEAHLIELLPSSTKLNLTARNSRDAEFEPVERKILLDLLGGLETLYNRPRPQQQVHPCPPGSERNADSDCKPQIEIIR